MINLNGVIYETIEELEVVIADLSETQKAYLRNEFNGVPNLPPVKNVPKEITPRQARQALFLSGVSEAAVEAALNGLTEPTRTMALIDWQYSIAFIRANPLIAGVGGMLGWSADQLDDLFILGATL